MKEMAYPMEPQAQPRGDLSVLASNSTALEWLLPYSDSQPLWPTPAPRLDDLSSGSAREVNLGGSIQIIVDNLLGSGMEWDDVILVSSALLPKLLARAKKEPPSPDWERELSEL